MDNTRDVNFNRREALKLGAVAALGGLVTAKGTCGGEPKRPSMHAYANYAWLRGFSVVPSWGARIEEAWWNYDGARFREEVATARSLNANCIRLWIEYTAWMAAPEIVTERFFDAIKAVDENGMKAMPCLFNRWHEKKWDYGGQSIDNLLRGDWTPQLEYVRTLVTPLAADSRVLIWDLCNEPNALNLNEDWSKREFEWLRQVGDTVRQCGVTQPITIGTMWEPNINVYAPLCDVLCAHPYVFTCEELKKLTGVYRSLCEKHGKPLLVNECIPGALDDARRADMAKFYTRTLSDAGFGWMGWALREGKAVSTRKDRCDASGPDGDGDGFHAFVARDGKLRPGLEFLREPPSLLPPWKAS